MNIKVIIIGIVSVVCCLACTREPEGATHEGIPTTLQLTTREAGDTEYEIRSLHVLVFRSSGEPLSNDYFTGLSITDPITIRTTTGERKLLIIANAPDALKDALSHNLTHGQAKALILATPYVAGDILPFVFQTDLVVKETGNATIAAKLERAVSKVALRIGKSEDLAETDVSLLEIQLRQTPQKSWLLPRATGDWVEAGGDAAPLTDLPLMKFTTDNTLTTETPKVVTMDRYLFEYNAGDAQNATTALYVKIRNNGVEKEYTLPFFFLNDKGEKKYGIKRNSHLTIDATVYPKSLRIEKYTVDSWQSEAPWDKDVEPGGEDGNTSIEMWIDDDGRIVIDGLT